VVVKVAGVSIRDVPDAGVMVPTEGGIFVWTLMVMFVVRPPNHATPSLTICHWKLVAPAVVGAIIVKVNVLVWPGAIESVPASSTLFRPQMELSRGF